MNEAELEDIESHLYSQIYHQSNDEPETDLTPEPQKKNFSKAANEMRKPGRYFGPWSPSSKFIRNDSSRPQIPNKSDQTRGFYSKNSTRPYRPDISINQVVVLSPKRPIVCMTPREIKKARWKEKLKERRKKNPKITDKSVEKVVITLSDSEEDSCVVVHNQPPVVVSVGDSDEDIKSKLRDKAELNETSDDVIFIEPGNATVEVINLDEESESSPQKTIETSNVHSLPPKQIHRERKELLSTPDSASNDFMHNSGVELGQNNFNFSLHGFDFNSGEFIKPGKRTETCETESSSSTTDVNSVNLMKTAVFNEIEFPKDDIFSENNLESFGNFITPSRKNTSGARAESSPILKPAEVQTENIYSSDSSSESDYEDVVQKNKNLPELSPMHSTTSQKAKKLPNISSKYDLINSEAPSKQEKQKKKKKKNKKKKSDLTSSSVKSTEENVSPIEEALKEKKRTSSQFEGTEENTESKKKAKLRKKIEENSVVVNISTTAPLTVEKVEIQKISEETRKTEDTPIKVEKNEANSALEGLTVIDETFCEPSEIPVVLSSDSESILSALKEEQDIQINCKGEALPSTSKDPNDFSVRNIQLAMSSDPNLWVILDSDRNPSGKSKGRRCNKCRELGHMAIRCPNKVEVKCQLCGERGHYEPRCPNKICTQCGQRSPYFTTYCSSCFKFRNYRCQMCSMFGHVTNACPDLWRRYHLTTSEGPLTAYDGPPLKQNDQLWCSGCAQSGHLEHACRFYKSLYPPSDPYIKSYDEIYENQSNRGEHREQFKSPQPQANYAMDQRYLEGCNVYNQNNNYSQYGNPYLFMTNQQNFHPSGPGNMNAGQSIGNFRFEDNLPSFISFESGQIPNHQEVPDLPNNPNNNPGPIVPRMAKSKLMRHTNFLFFSAPAEELYHFIHEELQKLAKLTYMSNRVAKEVKRRPYPRSVSQKGDYYHTVNMVLFGIFNLFDGKRHLEKLKQFKRVNRRLNSGFRNQLYRSYCYIFGREGHEGVDYHELLRRI